MAHAETDAQGRILAADGTPLKQSLQRALRAQKMRALLLIAPLLLFVVITFVMPIGDMLLRSVQNKAGTHYVPDLIPNVAEQIEDWDPASGELPPEEVFRAMVVDLQVAFDEKNHTQLGRRFNYESPGMDSLFRTSGRRVSGLDLETDGPFREALIDINDDWGDLEYWATIKANSGYYTNSFFLAAVDMERDSTGIAQKDPDQRIYRKLLVRTLWLSAVITFCTLLLGYPVAWLLADLPARKANLLLILVLLPFWTSLLVRTSSWKILLQQEGVINDFWVWLGFVERLSLINNQLGVVIAMTHILLPLDRKSVV